MAKAADNVFTKEERAAVQETARERKKSGKLTPEQERAEGEADVQAKIAGMPADDRAMASESTSSSSRPSRHSSPRRTTGCRPMRWTAR